MARSHYERLNALDASFLEIETPNARWHEGAVMIFDRGPLTAPDGGVDAGRITRIYEALLDRVDRYRQRLAFVPWFDHPVWVDDPSFNLRYHIRHISLPAPGDERTLKRVCGYLLSQPLDLDKPLWEVWIVDGLENDRFALVSKTHHCMVDGASGMSIMAALLNPKPDETIPVAAPWEPRPAPSGARLFAGELERRVTAPLDLVKPLLHPRQAFNDAWEVVSGLAESAKLSWGGVSDTIFNPESIGPHRRFDWASMPLSEVKEVKNRLGGTVNDVVLATAAGALGEFIRTHQGATGELDFRVLVPVNIRSEHETRRLGNRVAMMMAELPVGERDPRKRYDEVVTVTTRLKRSNQARGVQWLQDFSDRIGGRLMVEASRMVTRVRPFNVAVTNVPGPPMPLYLLGARLQAIYPMVPLFSNQALGIAVMSCDGQVFWGLNSDWDSLPDLHDLVGHLQLSFEELRKEAALL
jgi:WS/DGAT/MGAT family acyltransferase